jgi:hypothetical protein
MGYNADFEAQMGRRSRKASGAPARCHRLPKYQEEIKKFLLDHGSYP